MNIFMLKTSLRAVSNISTDVGHRITLVDNDAVMKYSTFEKFGFDLQNWVSILHDVEFRDWN